MSLVHKAYKFAEQAHRGVKRKYVDEPYINHPVAVMMMYLDRYLTFKSPDPVGLAACLLHDVIEDCGVSYDTLKTEFGTEVADLVLELTSYSDIHKLKERGFKRRERQEYDLVYLKAVSPKAKIIKYIDRICNLKDFDPSVPEAVGFFRSKYLNESRQLGEALGTDSISHLHFNLLLTATIKEIEDKLNG
jgi:guanosine-3',5'-bis(diphosphate) 3'-pyrophosphohydrolase